MIDYMVISGEPGKYTVCQTWVNPPQTAWVGRLGDVEKPHAGFEATAAVEAEDISIDRARLVEWCSWRGHGAVLPERTVNRKRLAEILDWLPASDVVLVAAVSWQDIPSVRVRAGEAVAVLACIDATKLDSDAPTFAGYCAVAEKYGDNMPSRVWPPVALLWFDGEGNGPDVVEARISATSHAVTDGGSVEIAILELVDGGGFLDTGRARDLARQILAAADWADARKALTRK